MLRIARVATLKECAALEPLQREVWSGHLVLAAPHMFASITCGGILVGAYDGAQPVGFCYGFPARKRWNVWLHSHMLAVLPAYRGQDLGFQLKVAQRQAALEDEYSVVSWTFDPLQYVNARLNLARLGAVGTAYLVDYYGPMEDPLNRGLPTDRILLEWSIASPAVAERIARSSAGPEPVGLPVINRVAAERTGGLACATPDLSLTHPEVLMRIPTEFAALRNRDPGLAREWRLKTRQAFSHYLGTGYRAVDLFPGRETCAYLLEKGRSG
ncbi:MAG TPA: GNAT family N-acetyltransferase [Bacillota bacterium]|nr:GNAT family N-acetyltransferase [Bacillota bacterium]